MSDYNNIWVVSETLHDYPALCALAQDLGNNEGTKVSALWMGDIEGVRSPLMRGIDAVYFTPQEEQGFFIANNASILDTIGQNLPDAILFATSKNMRLLSAQLAAKLETRVLNDITAVSFEGADLIIEHMVYGGSAIRRERVAHTPAVALVSESLLISLADKGVRVSASNQAQSKLIEIAGKPARDIKLVSRKALEVETVDLAGAQVVISVGRGIEKKEDLGLIADLATILGGEIGCTRPIAEGMNWMSHERYIGVSGTTVKPTLFVAVGLSGQIQHMVGANCSKTIVAINKDKNAPIFKQADYGMIGDLCDIVPRLTEALK